MGLKHLALWSIALIGVLVSFLYLASSGLREREQENPRDSEIFYVAGRCWVHLQSPYDSETWLRTFTEATKQDGRLPGRAWYTQGSCFAYPPTVAAIIGPFALFPYDTARRCFALLNLGAWAAVCFLAWKWISPHNNPDKLRFLIFVGASGFGTQALPQTFWHGQLGLLVLACTLGAFWAWQTGNRSLGALFVMLAAAKPQISALPLFYLLLAGGHTIVLSGTLAVVLFSLAALALLPGGIQQSLPDFTLAYDRFRNFSDYDSLKNYYSLPGFLGESVYGHQIMLAGVFAGALLVTALAVLKRRGQPSLPAESSGGNCPQTTDPAHDWRFHLYVSMALTVGLMPLHPYDLVMVAALILLLPLVRNVKVEVLAFFLLLLPGRAQNLSQLVSKSLGLESHETLHYLPHVMSLLLVITCLWLWCYAIYEYRGTNRKRPFAQ